jgi:hypothetical protein
VGWETRRGKHRYYTRSIRVGGRVVREYVGTGPAAEAAAAHDARRRADGLARRARQRAAEARYRAAIAPLVALCRLTDRLLAAALADRGFHRHDRGVWRRKRHGPE